MKNLLLFLGLLFCGQLFAQPGDFRQKAPQAGPAPKIELGTSENFTLDNGIKVIVVSNRKLPRVSIEFFLDLPPIVEGEKAGAAELTGTMLSRGTTGRKKADLDKQIDLLGASISTSATGAKGYSLSKHAPALVSILAEMVQSPAFDPAELEKVRKLKESDLQQLSDNADQISGRLQQALNFGPYHPYGELLTEESLSKINIDDCKAFYNNYFDPKTAYLVFVGDIDKKTAKEMAETHFAKMKKSPQALANNAPLAAPLVLKGQNFAFVNKPGGVQSVINITYPITYTMTSPDYLQARVMNMVLGGYFRSRINNNLREDKGYTYGAGSSLQADRLMGQFSTYGSYRNEVTDSALIQLLAEMKGMTEKEIPAEELSMVKNVMSGSFARQLEEPGTVANYALNIARFGLPANFYETYLQRIEKITAAEVLAAAKKYVHPDMANIVVIANKDKVAASIEQLAPNKKLNYFDLNGKPLQTIKVETPGDATAQTVIDKYLTALGGRSAIESMKTISIKSNFVINGKTIEVDRYIEQGKRVAILTKMGEKVMQRRYFDDGRGWDVAAGQKDELEGFDLRSVREDQYFVPELYIAGFGIKTVLKGAEQLDGRNVYVLDYLYENGSFSTHYFDMETGFKLRSIENTGEQMITIDYSEPVKFGTVMSPSKIKLTGAAPQPLKFTVTEIMGNPAIDPALFE